MFEIESKDQDIIVINTKTTSIKFDLANETIDANLEVGKIVGPGEFEIGEVAIRGIAVGADKTIYDAVVNNVHVGIIGGVEDATALDELGIADILCTSSVRAVREIEPKMVVSMGNIDGMVMDLKVSARTEKKLKVKSLESLPAALEVVALA